MSENTTPPVAALTADQLADKRIIKQLVICIAVMMAIAIAIATTATSIA